MTVNTKLALAGVGLILLVVVGVNADKSTTPSVPGPVPVSQAPVLPNPAPAYNSPPTPTVPVSPTASAPVAAPSPPTDDQITSSIEYKLAVVEKGDYVAPDDPMVAELGAQLDKLQTKCDSPRDRLANVMVAIHDHMKEKGVDESYLSILTHVNESIPDGVYYHGAEISEPFAAYATLRVPSN